MIHYTPTYLLNPSHKITVALIGLGGTGSQVLTCLARINSTLLALNHPGLHVIAIDDDIVSEANLGRQLFSQSDIGRYKVHVLTERINRFFGLNWEAIPKRLQAKYNRKSQPYQLKYNIIISCVDSIESRKIIRSVTKFTAGSPLTNRNDYEQTYYWLDFGNNNNTGQVVLSDYQLPDIFDMFPAFKSQKEDTNTPSCSVAESIKKQGLFINSTLAHLGCDLLWKLFHEGKLTHHGLFLNLETLTVKPIKIK